jgi:hypothetical protein
MIRALAKWSACIAGVVIVPSLAYGAPPATANAPSPGRGEPSSVPGAESTSADRDQVGDAPLTENYYLDPARGPVSFRPEYEQWFGDARRPPHYARATVELLGVLAIGTSYYWLNSDPNKQDWDYLDFRDRSFNVEVKFDNNMFRTNFLLHPLAGTVSYWLARANGLDLYASATASILSSATFEFLLEWLEKPSVNDLLATPMGGIAAGEFFFHLGDYLNSAFGRDNTMQRVLAYSVGAPQGIHSAMDGVRAPSGTSDALGYSAAYWHRFGIGYGVASVSNGHGDSETLQDLLVEARLVAMPGFLRPGKFSVSFRQGNFTEARLRASMAGGLLKDVDLWFGSDLAGYYTQDYSVSTSTLTGSAATLAASVDMRYVDRWLFNRREQWALFHFLGPSTKVWLALGHGVMAQAEARLHLDFAGITSPAYKILVAERGSIGTKTVLQLQDYYQGFGASGRLAASLALGGLELGGYARYGAYRSIDGLDRYASPLDVANTDQIVELGAALAFCPPAAPLSFRLTYEGTEHRSQMGPYATSLRDRRAAATAIMSF